MFKKIKLICMAALVAATIMGITSCSKEDKIVGKWKVTRVTGEIGGEKDDIWTFKENGSCSVVITGIDFDGDWSISKDNLSIDINENGYKFVGDFTIDELSSKELSISGKWTYKNYGESYKANYDFEKK